MEKNLNAIFASLDKLNAEIEQNNNAIEAATDAYFALIEAKKQPGRLFAAANDPEIKAARAAKEAEINRLQTANTSAKIAKKIVFDNARIVAGEMLIAAITETLKKYDGKPYGEKTKEKIAKEICDKTGFYFYITRHYSFEDYYITPAWEHDTHKYFNSCDFYFDARTNDNTRGEILNGNKINISGLVFSFATGISFVSDVPARVAEILKNWETAKEAAANYAKAAAAFNEIIPSGMDRISVDVPGRVI